MVVAKGQRLIAEEIKQIADNHNIPIIENPPVARLLFKLSTLDTMFQKRPLK